MSRTKKIRKTGSAVSEKPSVQDLNLEVESLLKKSRVWVGLAIVLLILGGGIYFINNSSKEKENSQIVNLVSPEPTAVETTQVSASPIASASPKPVVMAKKVKTLADTNGKIELTVQEGDSFWKISEKICGNGKYFLDIQSSLGYSDRAIHPGDKLVVTCPE